MSNHVPEGLRRTKKCSACNAEVFFAPHIKSGNLMIFNAEPEPNAHWVLENGRVRYCYPTAPPDVPRYMPHHATCPSWQKTKKK